MPLFTLLLYIYIYFSEAAVKSSYRRCKKRVFLKIQQNFVPPTQMFSCEIRENFKNTCFEANLRTTASEPFIGVLQKNFSEIFHQIFETTSASACFLESYNFSNKGRHRICFPSSFTKFSRTPLLPNIFVVPLLRITIHIAFNQSVTNEIFIPLSEETSIHFKRPIAGITKMHEVLSS